MPSNSSFFVYTDATGVDVVVQHLADVPAQYRAQARQLDLSKPAKTVSAGRGGRDDSTQGSASPMPDAVDGKQGVSANFHGPSFAMGVVTAISVGLVIWLASRRTGRILSLAFGLLILAVLGLGYLAYLRQQVGLRPAGLTTPAVLIDDARSAAGTVDKRYQEQEREMREIEKNQ